MNLRFMSIFFVVVAAGYLAFGNFLKESTVMAPVNVVSEVGTGIGQAFQGALSVAGRLIRTAI